MICWILGLRLIFAYSGESWPALTLGMMGVYFSFVLMTWLIEPLFNVVLSFDAHGKYLLTPVEHRDARHMGLLLSLGIGHGRLAQPVHQSLAGGITLPLYAHSPLGYTEHHPCTPPLFFKLLHTVFGFTGRGNRYELGARSSQCLSL